MNRVRRRCRQLVAFVYALACLGCVAMVIGPALDDYTISRAPERALARVTNTGWLRTTVEFQDTAGLYHTPPSGVAYPSGLQEGQRVWVEYAAHDPRVVKVADRGWTLAFIPAASTWVVATLVALALWWAVGRFA